MDDCAQGAHSRERIVDQKQTKDRVWGWASGELLHPSSPCSLSSLSIRFCEQHSGKYEEPWAVRLRKGMIGQMSVFTLGGSGGAESACNVGDLG